MYRYLPDFDRKIYETKKGNRYKFGTFQDGARCILFPDYCEFDRTVTWFAPTEKKIFFLDDDEIIREYKKLDSDNKINRKEINKFYHTEIIKEVNWKVVR